MKLGRAALFHVALIAILFGLQFVLPQYDHLILTRVMVLAVFAVGYNILYGYTGLLSLGHAMFFAAGLYGAGLTSLHLGWEAPAAFLAGVFAGLAFALLVGLVALRTTGVAFMIVTMMFSQASFLLTLYLGDYTRGDEGFTLPEAARRFAMLGLNVDLTSEYTAAYLLVVGVLLVLLILFFPKGILGTVREKWLPWLP